ncbi:MAG: XRE family transcriptional regulator [Acholeplasmataceae bacterium]|nr:XRE family transcriptional regulator [Acholeplasmataceae bacterium]
MNRRIAPTSLFIKRFMKENNVSQKKLSELTGYTEKQISLILNDKTNVTKKFAQGLSESIDGLDADFVMRYAKTYQDQVNQDRLFLDANNYIDFSKKYGFSKIFKKITTDPFEQTTRVLEAFEIDNLSALPRSLESSPFSRNVLFSKDASKINEKDNQIVTIWTKIAVMQMIIGEEEKHFIGRTQSLDILKQHKALLNVSNSNDLITNIKYICDLCGIHIGFTKSVPTTYIRGLSFSLDGQIYIILTDRFKKIEYVVFAFVHEMFHIIAGDVTPENEAIRVIDGESDAEDEANKNAKRFIVPDDIFSDITDKENAPIATLFKVAKEARCSMGLLVSRLQHETKDYQKNWQYLNSFSIDVDMFGN